MLFLLFGSSGAGKTFVLDALRRRQPQLAIHDFDEIGVPAAADLLWRQQANEAWVRRALESQDRRMDVLLAGQTPIGELLATPSAPLLDCISACLLDCDDRTRIRRLRARDSAWWAASPGALEDFLAWADWMRRHAADPSWRQDVLQRENGLPGLHWERWCGWNAGDRRWRVRVIDTSTLGVESVADELSAWIQEERELYEAGTHPLSDWASRTA